MRSTPTTLTARPRLRHIPALDGLRGLALLGVLFFHAEGALPGGFLGVDLFFVLSGFLITSLLLAEHRDTGRIALSAFWVRRARRLFPALLSLMPAIALYSRFFAEADALTGLRADALATLGYVANWRAIFSQKSYWQLFVSPSPLEHTWSLSIEEQFYVVWPLLVVLVLRRGGSRYLLGLTLALAVLSMGAMTAVFRPDAVSRAYLGTDTRASGMLAGAALACVLSMTPAFAPRTVRILDVMGGAAGICLAVAWCTVDGENPLLYHGGFWVSELLALVLIACAVAGSTSLVASALAVRPLTFLGTISYGVYLWHWPVNVVLTPARVHVGGFWLHALQFVTTFAIAIVSYRYLEVPIRARGVPFGRPVYMVPAAVALSVFLVVRATAARQVTHSYAGEPFHHDELDERAPGASAPPSLASPALDPNGLSPSMEPVTFQVMLLGDSTANSLGWALRGARKPGVAVELRGLDGCTMLADLCGGPLWEKHTNDVRPDATLVFLGGAFMHGLTVDGRFRKACHAGWDAKFQSTLAHRLGSLLSPAGHVWAATLPYALGPWETPAFRREVDCINVAIRKASASVPGVNILDLAEHLCPKGVCVREAASGTGLIRPDGVHFAVDGAADLATWVLEEIRP